MALIRDIVKVAKKILPKTLFNSVKKKYKVIYFYLVRFRYRKVVRRLRKKDKIRVAFFLIHSSVWKYDGVYRLLEKDDRFDPVVIVCPYTSYGDETMLNEMRSSYNSFKEKGYNVIKSLNEETGKWLNVKEEIQPDVVFFTNPHPVTKKEYSITNYLDCLTCYAPYGITQTHLNAMQYNMEFHNVLWAYFVETEVHKEMAIKYSDFKGRNTLVTGFPGVDTFFEKDYKPQDPWKIKDRKIKRIIWAPHHSLDEDKTYLSYSNFLSLNQAMPALANEYKEEIQITFKPHPLLKPKLYMEPSWGKEKTDIYYNQWKNLANGQLNESDYLDLFITSDAMILDSGSFLNEYLCVNKPSLYIMRDKNITDRFNIFGKMAFSFHYHGSDVNDIKEFIKNNVIGDHDELKKEREDFIRKYLKPPGGSASENIYKHLVKNLTYA